MKKMLQMIGWCNERGGGGEIDEEMNTAHV